MCEQQYFFEYVLGYRSPSNKKADKGTICHKALEILAFIKLTEQNGELIYNDDILGNIDIKNYNLTTIIEKVYKYYTSKFVHHEWDIKDYKDCHKWIYKAITEHNGNFDPRSRDILKPEQHFDIEIKKPWSSYKYDTKDGILEGNLAIKGTIDLITKVNDSTIEIIDWKTGRRLDWATGEEKTFKKLENDPQLRLYHYAASMLYPDIDHIMVSINFINDGGVFSMCYDKKDLPATELMIKEKFETIKRCKKPRLNKTWKCNKLCYFGKNYFPNALVEYRDNQTCANGTPMTMCEQIKHDIELKGIQNVVDSYTVSGYSVGKYKAPGSTE